MHVLISGSGRGALSRAFSERLKAEGMTVEFHREGPRRHSFDTKELNDKGETTWYRSFDVAICTAGKMLIADPATVDQRFTMSPNPLDDMVEANYKYPRWFIECAIRDYIAAKTPGQIIVIGSNSARYGKPFAEDYASLKSALAKYCELRATTAKEHGIRITCLNLGGIVNDFWKNVRSSPGFDAEAAKRLQMIPEEGKGMTSEEVAELVLAIIRLPKRVAIKDMLVVGTAYQ